ncbi:MAG: two-component regulator propeller domain-containing protein [Anaerolineae bacterium]
MNTSFKWRIGIWLLATIVACAPLTGQAAEELASLWTAFTVQDGLRSGNILSILVGQDGGLWFGTDAGVGHYDGSWRWLSEADGVPPGKVRAIVQTADGTLWFATSAGLASLAPGSPCCDRWTVDRNLPANDVLSLVAAPAATTGNGYAGVWVGTARGLVYVDAQQVRPEDAVPPLGISALAFAADGRLLAGVQGRGVWQRDLDGRWQELDGTASLQGDVYTLLPEPDGTLWAGTANGLVVRRPGGTWERFPLAEDNNLSPVLAVVRDPYGGLWAATDRGVYYDPDAAIGGLPVSHIRAQPGGLINDYVRALALDQDNALWLGTIAGISRYAGIIWHVITDEAVRSQRINAVLADHTGRIWVATETNGLVLREGTDWRHFTVREGLPDNRVVTLFEDDAGRVWVATGTAVGLMTERRGSWRFEPLDTGGLIELPVFAFEQDGQGNLWLGGKRGGVRWTELGGVVPVVELEGKRVNAIYQARNGVLWFGTQSDGVLRHIEGQWQLLSPGVSVTQLNDVIVNGIGETDDGSLWVGTYNNGLWRFRDGLWERNDMNLASPKILALHFTRNNLWVGTRQGLSRFDGLTWQNYRGDALPGGPWVTALTAEKDGTLWIGSTAGLVQYRPEQTRPWVQIGTVNLEKPQNGRLDLKRDTLQIIQLYGGDLATRADDLLYLTQVQGLEATPRVHTMPQITAYADLALAPGVYVLRAMVRDAAFNYSPPVELTIMVPKMVTLPGGYKMRANLFYLLLVGGALVFTGAGVSSGVALRARARAQRLTAEKAQRQCEALARGFNPYISGKPIYEPNMFFGRKELLQRIFNALHQNNIMIHGERRMGKTTLLYQLANQLRQADDPEWAFVPIYIDLEGTPEERFFYQLMDAIWSTLQSFLQQQTIHLRISTAIPEKYNDLDFTADLRELLERLKDMTAPRKLRMILLMDEMDVISNYDTRVQQQFRRILMSSLATNLGAVVAGVHISKDWDRLESPWYNLFNEISLEPFTPEEARSLLIEPVRGIYEWEPAAVEFVIRQAAGRPHRLQQYALEAVNRMLAAGRLQITQADVEAAHQAVEYSQRT